MLFVPDLAQLILQSLDSLPNLFLRRQIISKARRLNDVVQLFEDLVDIAASAGEDFGAGFEGGDAVFGFEFGGALGEGFGSVGWGTGGGFVGFGGGGCACVGAVKGGRAGVGHVRGGGFAVDFRSGGRGHIC